VLVLHKDHSLRKTLRRLEKCSVPVEPTSVEVRPSATHGLGLFATKDFLPGDLVLSERPMVSAMSFNWHVKVETNCFANEVGWDTGSWF
jgi:hypothetical protein